MSNSGLTRKDSGKLVTDWPTIRRWVLHRDGFVCQICKVSDATDVDHIWPRRLGGTDHVDNLQAACGPCNKEKGAGVFLPRASQEELLLAADALCDRAIRLVQEIGHVIVWQQAAYKSTRASLDHLQAEVAGVQSLVDYLGSARHAAQAPANAVVAVGGDDGYCVNTEQATWAEVADAGLENRDDMERLRPFMENKPSVTVGQALAKAQQRAMA